LELRDNLCDRCDFFAPSARNFFSRYPSVDGAMPANFDSFYIIHSSLCGKKNTNHKELKGCTKSHKGFFVFTICKIYFTNSKTIFKLHTTNLKRFLDDEL